MIVPSTTRMQRSANCWRPIRRFGGDLVLVLVSDHGEGFGEYGLKAGHGYSVRQNQLHVPIVFYAPRWLPRGRVAEPASLVDIAPTLLDLFSLAPLPRRSGGDHCSPTPKRRPTPSTRKRTWFLWEANGATLLARVGADGRKLVTGYQRPVSWRLAESPCEDTAHGRGPRCDRAVGARSIRASAARGGRMVGLELRGIGAGPHRPPMTSRGFVRSAICSESPSLPG